VLEGDSKDGEERSDRRSESREATAKHFESSQSSVVKRCLSQTLGRLRTVGLSGCRAVGCRILGRPGNRGKSAC
jgi:hypothetical protein